MHFGGTWTTTRSRSYSGGSSRYAKGAGVYAYYSFTGTSIGWVTTLGATRGSAKVYIDGVYRATISTYAATTTYRRVAYVFSWPTQGTHTIKIVVVGTTGHPRVDVDAFARIYRP